MSKPHLFNLSAESAVIGTVLFDNTAYEDLAAIVRWDSFSVQAHRLLWKRMGALIETGQTADGITLESFATDTPEIHEVGGAKLLFNLLDGAAMGLMEAKDYARIVTDLAGRRVLWAALDAMREEVSRPSGGASASAIIEHLREHITEAEGAIGHASDTIRSPEMVIGEWLDALEHHAREGTRPPSGISTGLTRLDKLTGRWQPGELIILAGRPSMGKTAMAANIAQQASVRDEEGRERPARVGFLSLEMHAEPLAMRWSAQAARRAELGRIDYSLARDGKLNSTEIAILREGWRRMPKTTLWETRGKLSMDEVSVTARAMRRKLGGLDLLVIDYLQIMRINESRNGNRASDIGDITSELKALAKALNIPILCLSQLSRNVEMRENKRPQLSDLRESGAIEQDADIVIFAYRDSYYLERSEPQGASKDKWHDWNNQISSAKGVLEAICAKARMGAIGTAFLHFEPETDTVVDDKKQLKEEVLV